MQSRKASLAESICNVASGFLISLAVWQFIVGPLFGIHRTVHEGLGITAIFTVTSVLRSYLWRRCFNGAWKAPKTHEVALGGFRYTCEGKGMVDPSDPAESEIDSLRY